MKSSKNKAKDVENSRKAKLEQELGKLTFDLAKMQKMANVMAKRSNKILEELEKLK